MIKLLQSWWKKGTIQHVLFLGALGTFFAGTMSIYWNGLVEALAYLMAFNFGWDLDTKAGIRMFLLVSLALSPAIGEEIAKLIAYRISLRKDNKQKWARNRWGWVETLIVAITFMSVEAWLYGLRGAGAGIADVWSAFWFEWLVRALLIAHINFWAIMFLLRFKWWSWIVSGTFHFVNNWAIVIYYFGDPAHKLEQFFWLQMYLAGSIAVWLTLFATYVTGIKLKFTKGK